MDKYERRQWFDRLVVMRNQYRVRSAIHAPGFPATYMDFSTVDQTADQIAIRAWNIPMSQLTLGQVSTDKEANS